MEGTVYTRKCKLIGINENYLAFILNVAIISFYFYLIIIKIKHQKFFSNLILTSIYIINMNNRID